MSYTAIVTRIQTRPHPNADKLLLATCLGNQVVVSLETENDSLGLYFPADGQFSHEMVVENNLYNNSARQKLGLEPSEKPGFFDAHRRIRAQRFRGEKSDGIWLPLDSLDWTGADWSTLKEGDIFTEFGGFPVCNKYYTPATLKALRGGTPRTRKENKCFPKNEDVKQFRFVADSIPEDAVIYLTEKLHGTSGRFGFVLDTLPLPKWKEVINRVAWFGIEPPFANKLEYQYLNGSKNVTLGSSGDLNGGWYGTNEFRHDVIKDITLHKGEIIFFEIVGWVNETTPIMPPHDVKKTGLKDIRAQYGDTIHYHYNCQPGEHKIYVYKIALVNEDGVLVEQPWNYVTRRCGELGIPHVPLLFGPTTLSHLSHLWSTGPNEALRKTVEANTDGTSKLSLIPKEGVVVRVESSQGISHIKNKAFSFGVMEGYIREDDTYVDIEETN